MKSWDALTERGRLRRLRQVADDALCRYALRADRLRLVGGFTNAVFRVDAGAARFALRVDAMQDHSDAEVDAEVAWLDALAQDGLPTARVVKAASGAPYVFASAPGVPGPRRCVLFAWIPGRPLGRGATPAQYRALGKLSAELHLHARGHPGVGRPMPWDRVFYYPESVDPVVIHDASMAHHFTGGRRAVLDAALARVTKAFARRRSQELQLVHGDLHPWNVHTFRGALTALDFEDVMWAHPVQDVAITLSYLRERPDYAALRDSFEAGYRDVARWPETYPGELDCFIAARQLMFVNFVANVRADPSAFYATTFPQLERFLEAWG